MAHIHELFNFSASPVEIIFRGSIIFWFLFLIFRYILRRDIGNVGVSDFLFVVIVADASQNAMSGDAKTISDGILLISTLVFWNFAIDWASYKVEWIRKIMEAPAIILVRGGRLHHRNMRREFITKEEVMAKLREQGIETLAAVKEMRLESDGELSVIKQNG